MLDPVGLYGPARAGSSRRKTGAPDPSTPAATPNSGSDKKELKGTGSSAKSSRTANTESSNAHNRAQEKNKAAAAAAAKRERQEWERTRGAGSNVLLWYEDLRVCDPKALNDFHWSAVEVVPPLNEVLTRKHEPRDVVGMDRLLDWGICDYTILPRTLGRGRFSTVYLAVKNGQRYAIKHTPLFPHHELVATRLLREPTLLAELPPHPNLVSVVETIRTPGHFYLVEEFLDGYVTLEALIPKLSTNKPPKPPVLPLPAAEKIFSQLVLVLHAIHSPLRVCHRDVKPENVLVHPETLHLKLLDFGLATHFSKSRAKLTTCCGSPAFHCPEIVTALAQPPGTVAYWGPEVDAWTCGVTLLRCLSGIRYPLGTSHASPHSMASRAKHVLQTLPSHPLRDQIARLLDLNGEKRIKNFEEIAQHYLAQQKDPHETLRRELKSTSFCPNTPQHSMLLPLVLKTDPAGQMTPGASSHTDTTINQAEYPEYTQLTLLNPTKLHNLRILSFIKYCFRCAGILYHALPESDERTKQRTLWQAALGDASAGSSQPTTPYGDPGPSSRTFECVVELTQQESQGTFSSLVQSLMTMFGQQPKPEPLVIMPPQAEHPGTALPSPGKDKAVKPSSGPSGKQGPLRMLVFTVVVSFASVTDSPELDMAVPESPFPATAESGSRRPALGPRKPSTPLWHSEEPGLMIDTRPERLPQPSLPVSPASRWQSPSSRRSRRGTTSRPNAVHVYISDARAVPYVRGALSNGGVHKPDKPHAPAEPMRRSSTDRSMYPQSAPVSSPSRSAPPTPGAEDVSVEPFNADELVALLDAIDHACKSTLRTRTHAADEAGSAEDAASSPSPVQAQAQNLYRLVLRLFIQLEATLDNQEQCSAMQEQMSELNFRALDVLAPALSLVSATDSLRADQLALEANVGAESGKERAANTGSLALAILELFAHNSSAKEMCLGIQEQIERLIVAYQTRVTAPETNVPTEDEASMPLLRDGPTMVQAIFGLLQLLSMVLPEIQTRKPQAVLEPILSLLHPRLFCDVLPSALGRVEDPELLEELATQAAVLLCELVLSLRDLGEPRDGRESVELHALGPVLVNSLASLAAFLPRTIETPATGLRARLLSTCLYDQQLHGADESKLLDVSKRITVWNVIRKTYEKLALDLGELCLGAPDGQVTRDSLDATTAVAALELFVQQLAYEGFMARVKSRTRDRLLCRTQHAKHLSEPARWSAGVARELLGRVARVLPTVVYPGLSLLSLPPSPGTLERTQRVPETDALLALVFWLLAALDRQTARTPLDEECVTHLVRALGLLATTTPVPPLRQVAFSLVKRLVRDYAPDEVALRMAREMTDANTPAPLRAAGVSLVRELCHARIHALEAAQAPSADADGLLAHGRLWHTLHDAVFVLCDTPAAGPEREEELAAFLTRYGAYLVECCALYYFVRTRDVRGYTGLGEPRLDARIREQFLVPLRSFVAGWVALGESLDGALLTELELLRANVERIDRAEASSAARSS